MIICHCFNVSDREIRLAIALGATDIDTIGDECGAGLGCGNCHDTLLELLVEMAQKLGARAQSRDTSLDSQSSHIQL